MFCTQPIHGLGAASCRRGRRCAVPRGGRRGASLSPAADRRKRRCAVFRSLGFMVLQQKNLPLGGFSGLCESVVSWELFLLQKVPQSAREISLADFPFKRRLNDKGFSPAAACDQRLCLWKPQPFGKGWRKLLLFFSFQDNQVSVRADDAHLRLHDLL